MDLQSQKENKFLYQKNNYTFYYQLIYKPIKNIYFRFKDDILMISLPKNFKSKNIESIIDRNVNKIVKLKSRSKRIETLDFQLWGNPIEKMDRESYRKLLISETYKKIDDLKPKLVMDLKKVGLELKPTQVKLLKSKFGSCHTQKKIITINAFLAKLDPIYLYYVLLHEYAHLIVANHSKDFYHVLDKMMMNHKMIQKQLRKHQISY